MRNPKPSNEERDPAASMNDAKAANEDGQGADSGVTGDPRARVEQLEQECARLEAEVKAGHERLLRERADLENFKKRTAREREESLRYGTEGLVRDLLPVIDNLERALQHADAGGNGEPLAEGVRLVLESLRGVLERHGVSQVPALGERFDPTRHEAMEQVESDDHDPNTVVREHQRGYMLHDRLVRAALVGVSKPGSGGKPGAGGDERLH
jgi:molecular chaperone GrpE